MVHGDFHAGNVTLSRGRASVVDWTDARLGDPLWDLAWASLLLWIYEGEAAHTAFVDSYRRHADVSLEPCHLREMEVLAALRWLYLARTAPVPINEGWYLAAGRWLDARTHHSVACMVQGTAP